MSNKFSDFNCENNEQKKVDEIKKENPEMVNNIENLIDQYSKLNNEQLLNEFLKETKKAKQNGTINDNFISNIKSTLSPYLNDEQKYNLNNLMDMIDDKQN